LLVQHLPDIFDFKNEDVMETLKNYGSYSGYDFYHVVHGSFSPAVVYSPAEIESGFSDYSPEYLAIFLEAFREFLLDETMSFEEKADVYLQVDISEEGAVSYFRTCWEIISPDVPWPLPDKLGYDIDKDAWQHRADCEDAEDTERLDGPWIKAYLSASKRYIDTFGVVTHPGCEPFKAHDGSWQPHRYVLKGDILAVWVARVVNGKYELGLFAAQPHSDYVGLTPTVAALLYLLFDARRATGTYEVRFKGPIDRREDSPLNDGFDGDLPLAMFNCLEELGVELADDRKISAKEGEEIFKKGATALGLNPDEVSEKTLKQLRIPGCEESVGVSAFHGLGKVSEW
jgi:hypothetical protein